MPFTTHTDAGGRHWQHQNTGTFIPGLRKTDDCGFTSRALSSRIGSPFADKGVYESQTNSNVLEHMKRVNTSGLNISDKHSSIDFLRDLPDQVWKEEPSKIDHSSVQHDPHGIKLEDREFRIFVEKRLATNSIGRYEMLQILIGNGLSSFGTDDQLKDRLTAASARAQFKAEQHAEASREKLMTYTSPRPFPALKRFPPARPGAEVAGLAANCDITVDDLHNSQFNNLKPDLAFSRPATSHAPWEFIDFEGHHALDEHRTQQRAASAMPSIFSGSPRFGHPHHPRAKAKKGQHESFAAFGRQRGGIRLDGSRGASKLSTLDLQRQRSLSNGNEAWRMGSPAVK